MMKSYITEIHSIVKLGGENKMKKLFITLMAMLLLAGFLKPTVRLNAEEKNGCKIDKNGTIVCDEDIPDGCWFNPETLEVECPIDPLWDHDDERVKE